MSFHKLTENVSVTIHNNTVYLHMQKHRPVVINAEDRYRKGVKIGLCSKCRNLSVLIMSEYRLGRKREFCEVCCEEHIAKKSKENNKHEMQHQI